MKHASEILLGAVLVRALLIPEWPIAFMLLIAATVYVYERYSETQKVDLKPLYALFQKHADMINAVNDEVYKLKKEHIEVEKLAEETKRVLTSANVGIAFRPRILNKD